MFEDVVKGVLEGYLGRFVKGIRKDQLKIGIWNEEILLEKVELILEAFDYLQLPFALRNGRVGKLSIKIPWKKLGWDPIIVVLENVLICASQREDIEWCFDSVERRELAGKMAKLNAIELAKFSRRVSDNQAGQSFISYIYAKILDNIHVSIRDIHVVYVDNHKDQENFIFGLKLSSLTIMTDAQKHSYAGYSTGKSRVGQVKKIVEISNIGLYCLSSEENKALFDVDNTIEDQLLSISKFDLKEHDYILSPFNLTISLLVNKSGKLDGTPQYDITAELTTLVFSLDDILLQQILSLWDYFSICALKKKYGRYRPLQISLSRKLKGWQRMWWHYAINSVLADVRENLRKTSWSSLGERMSYRHKYTSLYKRKLELLQKGQSVSEDIQQELAKMEKECDLEDILSYRSLAEQQLQDTFCKSNSPAREINDSIAEEKHQNIEESSSSIRNWLSWLSLGMLGAGGTYDSASFAGVVSDEIIKDIYEATEFHPESAFSGASSIKNTLCSIAVKLGASQIIISISNKGHRLMVADAMLSEMIVDCRFWEDSAAILASVDSIKIINPLNSNVVLIPKKNFDDMSLRERGLPFFSMEINLPQSDCNVETSTKVVLQPFEVSYDTEFFLYLGHIYNVIVSFKFQLDRVLTSLNGFGNAEIRLFSKIKYFLLNRGRLRWDITVHSFTVKLPSSSLCTKATSLVVEVDTFRLRSFNQNEDSRISDHKHYYEKMLTMFTNSTDSSELELLNLYDYMKIELAGLKVDLFKMTDIPKVVPIIENFNLSLDMALCVFLDEPSLEQLEVNCIVPSVVIHFTESIFLAFIALQDMFSVRKHQAFPGDDLSLDMIERDTMNFFRCSLSLKLDNLNFLIAFDENAESCTTISLILGDTDIRCAMEETLELWFIVHMLKVDASGLKDRSANTTLCSTSKEAWNQVLSTDGEHASPSVLDVQDNEISTAQGCFELQLLSQKHEHILQYECHLCLKGLDFHVHPHVSGLLQEFLGRLNTHFSTNCDSENQFKMDNSDARISDRVSDIGISNIINTGPPVFPNDFPFVSIDQSGFIDNPEDSHLLWIPELRNLFAKKKNGSKNINFGAKTPNQRSFDSSSDQNLLIINMSLYGLKVHFHDDSCIVATIAIPVAMSCSKFQEANTWDLLLSAKGLTLSSSWFSNDQHGILWGPSSSKCFPMLNIRVRKSKQNGLLPLIEITVGVKHVCCILPSEVLALIIGYFSLPDWTFKGNDYHINETDNFENSYEKTTDLLYKFEILESTVILPLENHTDYSLRVEFPQLLCIFIPRGKKTDAYREIPVECMISVCSDPNTVHILNISGTKASMSLLLLKDECSSSLKPDDFEINTVIPLIVQLDADLWIRIPCEMNSASDELGLLLMLNANIFTMIARDDYFVRGVQAFADVVDQFSSVGIRSKKYNSDVLQFLQLKRNAIENNTSVDISKESIIRTKICFKALSIMLSRATEDASFSEMIAKLEMQLLLSAISRNDILQSLDASSSYMIMHSSLTNLLLLSFASNSNNSQLLINLAQFEKGESLTLVDIPFLDIWLILPDWSNIIDLFHSLTAPLDVSVSSSADLHPRGHMTPDTYYSTAEAVEEQEANWNIKSENITISFHLPSSLEREKRESGIEMPKSFSSDPFCCSSTENMLPINSKHSRYAKFVFQSKYFEMTGGKNFVKSKCNMDELRAVLVIIKDQDITSIPCINVSQVKLDFQLCNMVGETASAIVEVHIESSNLAFSHDIIKFWTYFNFETPATSSPVGHQRLFVDIHLRKCSLLLSDGRWSCHGPMLEVLVKNVVMQFKQTEELMDGLVVAHLLVNYNNIDKVMWEPFVEPWCFQLNLTKKYPGNIHTITDVCLKSTEELNLNITEPFIEAIFRLNQMVNDASADDGVCEFQERKGILAFQSTDNILSKRYAPYILHNDTSLPLTFHVFHGHLDIDDMCEFPSAEGNIVQPGSSVPLYLEETLDEEFFQHRSAPSSERLLEKKMTSVTHHMISIQFDGTSAPSRPMSMDIVGLSFFEANFSRSKGTHLETHGDESNSGSNWNSEQYESNQNDGLIIPVVFEVSMQHYSKMIRLHSTVLLYNATSVPLELRFEIPFGVSCKILGPIHPGKEFPLPLHLAEASRIRWHPVGTQYLWSEAHILSKILSKENRLGFLRSFVCYPSHPSSHPFRCCLSIQDYSFSPSDASRNSSSVNSHEFQQQKFKESNRKLLKSNLSKKCFIRYVKLTTPLLIKNYLPMELSLTLDCGGVTHLITIPEADTTPVYLVDSAHDLVITCHMKGYNPIFSKFPRAESFSSMAKLDGSNFSLSEKLSFYPETSNEPICVSLDKAMDAYCGAREMSLSVPFLLYNCTGFLLTISDGNHERKGSTINIPSSYYEIGKGQQEEKKHGLAAISEKGSSKSPPSSRVGTDDVGASSSMATFPFYLLKESGNIKNSHSGSMRPCMYSPPGHSANEFLVKLSATLPKSRSGASHNPSWSKPFSLLPASGSTNITIPQPFTSGALLVAASSIPMTGELSGRTRIVTFQPRYVLCNACDNVMSYKQRGTNISYNLFAGQHTHLHWSDTTRELLISLRFNEPGWQWSGSFLPDFLGDTQVKMRNYITGASKMIRVEIQNADLAMSEEDGIKNSSGNSMTQLIILSDDKTGFMPYRIDNFSMEILRIYQHRCELFETTVHPYSSYQYAWDEPCFPHRLSIEILGERILGTYSLDDVKEHVPVYMPSTPEKPERRFHVCVHSEGATKVLSVIDSNYHTMKEMKETSLHGFKDKKNIDQSTDSRANFSEVITIHVPFLGISLINSSPQELIYVCARETTIVLMQSLEQQKLSFKTFSLQIDNQLTDTSYPIMLSFNNEQRGRAANLLKNKEKKLRIQSQSVSSSLSDGSYEPVIYFSAVKWRNADSSLVSFEHIHLNLAPLCIELEEQILLGFMEYFRVVTSRLQSRNLRKDTETRKLDSTSEITRGSLLDAQDYDHRGMPIVIARMGVQESQGGLLPPIFPIGAPWQQIFLLARKQKKIYIELFELGPISLSLSFSSAPWMRRNDICSDAESISHIKTTTAFQRSLMALVDVEGVPVHLRQLMLGHLIASWESIQGILIRHYTRQLLHEMYKVFGSAGVIGNPIGFARNVGLGIKDFLSDNGVVESPGGLFAGIMQGSKGLLNSTLYAMSTATSQFSKAAHKGIVAFAFDEQSTLDLEDQPNYLGSHDKGVLDEFFEGLTGLLQSPIRGAERHGLPGVLSGIAIGTAGLVARPVASVLEATGKTAQSIKNWSSPHQSGHLRTRLPRPLAKELPLSPYSWEEAIGVSALLHIDNSRLKDETFVVCKALRQAGKFFIITEKLALISWCPSLVTLGTPDFAGVPPDTQWGVEIEMSLNSVVHIDRTEEIVNIVGSHAETKKDMIRRKPWSPSRSMPLFHVSVELPNKDEAEYTLQALLSTVEEGKSRMWGAHILHRSNLR